MRLEDLRPAAGAKQPRKRVGRGPGSGHGKTATRGSKGHKARSGGGKGNGFEGGQMPLYRRLPKRGFLPPGGTTEYAVVNLDALARFPAGAVVDPAALVTAGVVRRRRSDRVKLLAGGDIEHALTVRVHAASAAARAKIEAKGGQVEILPARAPAS
jgi:large subunit ribosomal protein L15